MGGKFVIKERKKRSIGIKECAANGKYISLINYLTSEDVNISRWMLKLTVGSAPEIRYIIPDDVRLEQGKELRIYSKRGCMNSNESLNESVLSTLIQQRLVSHNVVSWAMGDTVETILFNHKSEEEASYLQAIDFKRNSR